MFVWTFHELSWECKMTERQKLWICFWEDDLSGFFSFSKQQKDNVGIHNEVSLSLKGTGSCDSHCLVSDCSSPSLLLGLSDQRHTTLLNAWMEDLLAHECGAVWRIWPLLGCWSMHTYMLTLYAMLSENSCILCTGLIRPLIQDSRIYSKPDSIPNISRQHFKTYKRHESCSHRKDKMPPFKSTEADLRCLVWKAFCCSN